MMRNAGHWWPRVMVAGVLMVLAVATVVGLRPAPGAALAQRAPAPSSSPTATAIEAPVPGPVLATVGALRATASSGEVAYALVGGALTIADIPTPALAAYQRAAAVIDRADSKCHLDWELVAALGKVLTDHGREHGSEFDDKGVSRPAVLGQRLSGRHGTIRVSDTDAGLLDRDSRFDRAVGPMLLVPAVWSVVHVDADGDGRRNPQDVDDAALSSAVFLCAGPGDFRNVSHVRSAIRRYHAGAGYTKSVLGVRAAYRDAQPVSTTVSVLAREEGVSPEAEEDPVAAPDGASFSAGPSFAPAPAPDDHPTGSLPSAPPSASPIPATPTPGNPSPTGEPSPSGTPDPSDEPSPTGSPTPSGSPSPSDDPCPTGEPTSTVEPADGPTAEPMATPCPAPAESPTESPAELSDASSHAAPASGTAVLLPAATWLCWRRRRRRA